MICTKLNHGHEVKKFSKSTPKNPAINIKNKSYSYFELDQMASCISNVLGDIKCQNLFVSILADKQIETYASILGILYSGKAYMPISTKIPLLRVLTMLEISSSEIMIVSNESISIFEKLIPHIKKKMTFIFFEKKSVEFNKKYSQHHLIYIDLKKSNGINNELRPVKEESPVYLLFTSGSTGKPKGVIVSNKNLFCYLNNINSKISFSSKDRFSHTFDLNFDLSVHDIFVCWGNGACLYVPDNSDLLLPINYLKKNKITIWFSVPSLAILIDNYGRLEEDIFPNIRYSLFCGEAFPVSIAKKWAIAAKNSKIINLYGPTETTIAISIYNLDYSSIDDEAINGIVPIGNLFENQKKLVLDENKKQVQDTEIGELCLSGSQVSNGYLKNIEKTNAQFFRLPNQLNILWYKTGDIVKKNKFGSLCYLGRVDNQVKINGNRIELSEIEHVIREVAKTSMVSVITVKNLNNISQIVAFMSDSKIDKEKILNFCNTKLPDYMIPSKIVIIDNMPLNINGKIDKNKLKKFLD